MTLQLYVLRRLALSFAVSLGGIALLVLPSIAVQAVGKMEGVGPGTILSYIPLVVVDLVPYLMPMAFLLAVVATFGRMAAERELVATSTAGIHPFRLLLPGLGMVVVLSALTHWIQAEISPAWKYASRDFLRHARADAFRTLGQGVTEIQHKGFYLKAQRQDPLDPHTFYGVILSLPREGQELTVFADRLRMGFDGDFLELSFEGFQVLRDDYEIFNQSPTWRIDMQELFPVQPGNPNRAKYMTSSAIRQELASPSQAFDADQVRTLRYEIQRRRAFSVTYLLFLLIGMPTGVFLRSGTQLAAFGAAVGYAFLYYLLALRLGKELATAGALPPGLAAWAADGVFLVLGLALLRRAVWR